MGRQQEGRRKVDESVVGKMNECSGNGRWGKRK